MSNHVLELRRDRQRDRTGQVHLEDSSYEVKASVRVRADTRRLYQALVVPEYLEAWIRIPEENVFGHPVASQVDGGLVLDCYKADARKLRISTSYLACRRRRLTMSWKVETSQRLSESAVDMRLAGDFECSILSIHQLGLKTFEDFAWHRLLWAGSLDRLARLF